MALQGRHFHDRGMNVLIPAACGRERNADAGYIQMGWQDSGDLVVWIESIVERDPKARIMLYGVLMGGAEVMMAFGWDLPANVKLIIEDCGHTSVWSEFELQLENAFGLPSLPVLDAAEVICRIRAGYGFVEGAGRAPLSSTNPEFYWSAVDGFVDRFLR